MNRSNDERNALPGGGPYQLPAERVLAALGSDARQGLTEVEARARLQRHGRNELTADTPVPAWRKFLAQFEDALVLLLIIATAVSAGLWWYERDAPLPYEAMAIFAVVLLNAVMGYVQESRAESAVAALRHMAAAHATVVRHGEPRSVAASDLVPGDVILVEEGDAIPADARVMQSTALQTAEGALTAESLPVSKDVAPISGERVLGDRVNMIFSGTAATYGRGRAVVVATAMHTEMGRIAGLLSAAPAETTPLQHELDRLGKRLGAIVVTIALVMTVTIILVQHVTGLPALFEVLILGVALAVAAVPEGLPAVVTAVLSIGVQRMAEVPFSSGRKLMSTVHTDRDRHDCVMVFTKGAPDVLLTRCTEELVGDGRRPLSDDRRREILETNDALAGRALRTLGIAFRSAPAGALSEEQLDERLEHDLVFAGLIGMIDPPSEEARDAVARAQGAGIRPIMITGDHPKTAAVIAHELGIGGGGDRRAVTGAELQHMSDDVLAQTVRTVSVYARVNPEDKLRIVRALQNQGAVVAMTGDGVNDAPALKTADIGLAMGITGTDVSKQAADMVLADDNFASIVAAVEEGRAIFSNIRKFLRYLLSSNIGEVMTMFFGVIFANIIGLQATGEAMVLPLLATQLLWINLVTDGAPALALGIDPADQGLMNQPPRAKRESVITGQMWSGIFTVGLVMAAGTLFVLDASLPGGLVAGVGDIRYGQTMAFTTLMLGQLFNVFNARSDERSAFANIFSNLWLWAAVGLSLLLQAAVLYLPFLQRAFSTRGLTANDWLRCVAVASAVLWVRELSKGMIGLNRRRATGPEI